jgi:hypothetical protein
MSFDYLACAEDTHGAVHVARGSGDVLTIDGANQPYLSGGTLGLVMACLPDGTPLVAWNAHSTGKARYAVAGWARFIELDFTYSTNPVALQPWSDGVRLVALRDGLNQIEYLLDAQGNLVSQQSNPTSRQFPSQGIRQLNPDGSAQWFDENLYRQVGPYTLANWRESEHFIVGAANNNPPVEGTFVWDKTLQMLDLVQLGATPIAPQVAGDVVVISGDAAAVVASESWQTWPSPSAIVPLGAATLFGMYCFLAETAPIANAIIPIRQTLDQWRVERNAGYRLIAGDDLVAGTTPDNFEWVLCSLEGVTDPAATVAAARAKAQALGKGLVLTMPVLTPAIGALAELGDVLSPYLYLNPGESVVDFQTRAESVIGVALASAADGVVIAPVWGCVERYDSTGAVVVTTEQANEVLIVGSILTAKHKTQVLLFRKGTTDYHAETDPFLAAWRNGQPCVSPIPVPAPVPPKPEPPKPPDPQPPIPPAGSAAGVFRRSR